MTNSGPAGVGPSLAEGGVGEGAPLSRLRKQVLAYSENLPA